MTLQFNPMTGEFELVFENGERVEIGDYIEITFVDQTMPFHIEELIRENGLNRYSYHIMLNHSLLFDDDNVPAVLETMLENLVTHLEPNRQYRLRSVKITQHDRQWHEFEIREGLHAQSNS